MNLYGQVLGRGIFDKKVYWSSPNLFFFYDDFPNEVCIIIDDVHDKLAEFLDDNSLPTKELFLSYKDKYYWIIKLSKLKEELLKEKESLDLSEACGPRPMIVKYKYYHQLNEIVSQIEMIAKIAKMQGKELYLKYALA